MLFRGPDIRAISVELLFVTVLLVLNDMAVLRVGAGEAVVWSVHLDSSHMELLPYEEAGQR